MEKDKIIIPVVFSFDDNILLAAGVCISSMLSHADDTTFYDIYILHDDSAKFPSTGFFDKLSKRFLNFKITYINVGNPFPSAFEIRGITIPAYYRLLIPEFILHYDKIMYHDVDVIIRSDLSKYYLETDLKGYYIAGVISASGNNPTINSYRQKLGVEPVNYINSGNLIFNCKKMREYGIVNEFRRHVGRPYKYQDQDIINIVCKGKIRFLPASYSGTIDMYRMAVNSISQNLFSIEELNQLLINGNIHYNGPKPWKDYCPNFDIWWEYYRNSVFFDAKFHFDFFHKKLQFLDTLSFKRRLNLLLRYFKTGQLN